MQAVRGFSTLEIIAVLAVAAVFASITFPVWETVQRNYRVVTAAGQLAGEIQAARLLAISRNATLQVTLDASSGTYQVIDPEEPSNPPRRAKSLPEGVLFQALPEQPLTFYSRGNSQSGTVQVGNTVFSRRISLVASGSVKVE